MREFHVLIRDLCMWYRGDNQREECEDYFAGCFLA